MAEQHPLVERLNSVKGYFTYDPSSPSALRWKVPLCRAHKPGAVAGSLYDSGYYIVRINKKNFRVHQLVLILNEIFPEKDQSEVDHIDRNPANNTVSNLRWTNRSGNLANRGALGSVKLRYVHKNRGKYMGQYTHPVSKRQLFVGRYLTAQEAHHQTIAHRLENHWIIP